MRRRLALAVMVAVVAVGLALIATGVAIGERPRLDWVVQAGAVYALAGYWAESRGVVAPRVWLARPDRLVAGVVARLTGSEVTR